MSRAAVATAQLRTRSGMPVVHCVPIKHYVNVDRSEMRRERSINELAIVCMFTGGYRCRKAACLNNRRDIGGALFLALTHLAAIGACLHSVNAPKWCRSMFNWTDCNGHVIWPYWNKCGQGWLHTRHQLSWS